MSAEFSVEDVRAQLTKLGYVDVPQQVIEKFMSRMKVQQSAVASAAPSAATPSVAAPLPPPPANPVPVITKPYTSAALAPAVPYVSPLSNLPVSSPVYSSLVQTVTPHPPTSNLPGLPLSLRTNPAFAAQQAAYLPSPSFATSAAVSTGTSAHTTFGPAATPKQNVFVEDEEEEDEDAYINRKNKEIEQLEARLKRHAVVAHGFTGISKLGVTSADMTATTKSPAPVATLKDDQTEVKLTHYRDSPSKENPVESPSKRIGSGRGFGSVRNDNIPAPSLSAAFPSKKIDTDLVARAERELRARMASLNLARTASTQSLTARAGSSSNRGRSLERPHSAAPHGRESSAPRNNTLGRPASAAVIPVVEMDTQRSLRKTYSNSVKKYKGLNPRYGDGGYRKSDPVTRYHAFKSKWDSSHFLNKKTSAGPTTSVATPAPTIGAKAVWRG